MRYENISYSFSCVSIILAIAGVLFEWDIELIFMFLGSTMIFYYLGVIFHRRRMKHMDKKERQQQYEDAFLPLVILGAFFLFFGIAGYLIGSLDMFWAQASIYAGVMFGFVISGTEKLSVFLWQRVCVPPYMADLFCGPPPPHRYQ